MLDRPAVTNILFDYLSPLTLCRLAVTCKAAHIAVNHFRDANFNINNLLSIFFDNPIGFRSLQAKTATIIAGSAALQFFNRVRYHDTGLDLYTHPGFTKAVGLWLILSEGYTFIPKYPGADPDFNNVSCIEWTPWNVSSHNARDARDIYGVIHDIYFFQKTKRDGIELRIQIVSTHDTPLQCLLHCHLSTMNPLPPLFF
jgi:hypothetical protein